MRSIRSYMTLSLVLLSVTGCEKIKDAIGLSQEEPDAFSVMAYPALEMPPEFTVRPPRPGEKPSHSPTAATKAQNILGHTPEKAPGSATVSTAETQRFLAEAGSEKAKPDIKGVIAADNRAESSNAQTFMQKLAGTAPTLSGDVIDPHEEAAKARLGRATSTDTITQ